MDTSSETQSIFKSAAKVGNNLPETQPLLPLERNHLDDEDDSDDDETNIRVWREFEIRRRSANHHLGEYIDALDTFNHDRASNPSDLSVSLRTDEAPESQAHWRLKAAQDGLINDSQALINLLDIMESSANKGVGKFYLLSLLLTIGLPITETSLISDSHTWWWKAAQIAMILVLSPSVAFIGYRGSRFTTARLCKRSVVQLRQMVLANAVGEGDRDRLRRLRFEVLWWLSYISSGKK